jgi:hypothetical protein
MIAELSVGEKAHTTMAKTSPIPTPDISAIIFPTNVSGGLFSVAAMEALAAMPG